MSSDDASYDELWELLTPAQRTKFMSALQDPTSSLAQDLLTAFGTEGSEVLPWWTINDDDVSSTAGGDSWILPHTALPPKRVGEKPQLIVVPASLVKPSQSSFPLAYNLVAIL